MMSRRLRLMLLALTFAASAVALTTTAYAWRDRLQQVPVLGELFKPAESWTCVMHPDVRSAHPGKCPLCGMDLTLLDPARAEESHASAHGAHALAASPGDPSVAAPASERDLDARVAVTIDGRRRQLVGVRTVEVLRRPLGRAVRATGVVKADETRQVDVNVKVDGWIETLHADYTGRPVKRGEPLFELYSPELVAAQNEFILALKSREQAQRSQVADARELADGLVAAARARLALWDLPDGQIAALEHGQPVARTIVFRAPTSGFVADKQAVRGMRVTAGQSLYRIVDLSRVWLEANVYSGELALLAPGTPATVTIDSFPGRAFNARLSFVAPLVDEATRTVRARFELANGDGRLRPGMFAAVDIRGAMRDVLVVPTDALLDTGRRQVVFAAEGDGYYTPRDVSIGTRVDGYVEVVSGLQAGQRVASSALFFLDSESQLRAALEGYQATTDDQPAEGSSRSTVNIHLSTDPDPLKSGSATFTVHVRDQDGRPVDDAKVVVLLYMPPMPSMNMPAMRSESRLSAIGNGDYRGAGEVMMAGRWDVTINVERDGSRIATRQVTLVAR